jgi:hypothetical protein
MIDRRPTGQASRLDRIKGVDLYLNLTPIGPHRPIATEVVAVLGAERHERTGERLGVGNG